MTSEFGAVWAHHRILNHTEADEAAEEFSKLAVVVGSSTASDRAHPRVDRLNARATVGAPG